MKNLGWLGLIVLVAVSFADLIAIGGKDGHGGHHGGGGHRHGGGGHHHGGGHHGGGVGQLSRQPSVIDRTPTMSRSGNRSLLNPAGGGVIQQHHHRNWNQGTGFNRGNWHHNKINRDNFNQNWKNKWVDHHHNANRVRNYYDQNRSYYKNWFHNHRGRYWNNRNNWWRGAQWGALSGWVGYDTGYPTYYYDTYSSEPVQLEPDVVNYIDVDVYAAPKSVDPTENLNVYIPVVAGAAATAPAVNDQPIEGDWMPLGVFAVGRETNDVEQANMFLQLAISKQGEISGTYYNTTTNVNQEIEGQLDKDTQQVSWSFSDNANSPIVTTGLYNLSQPETKVTVRFPNGMTQVWQLVRLQQ